MKLKCFKFNKWILPVIGGVVVLSLFLLFRFTASQEILDNSELEPNSDLIYYINVTYDGKDKNAVSSSDMGLSNVYSDSIYVEDILPADLSFQEFLVTGNGSIGAVERGTGNGCLGSVIDDSSLVPSTSTLVNTKGLHYDTTTRKVSFTVKGLQAGCELTVGVKTKTPETIDDKSTSEIEVRRDIYNTAQAKEKSQVVVSNTTHGWMGLSEEFLKMYQVSYQYDKEYPLAPALPDTRKYAENATVSIPTIPILDGYVFTGWKSEGITLIHGTFKMPSHDVVLVGSFEKLKDHTVTYRIEGEVPLGYEAPNLKSYFVGEAVKLDSTKEGFIYNGYRFLGWQVDSTLVKNGEFVMPDRDVVITGRFEPLKYKVSYAFSSVVKPENYSSLLPSEEEYRAGETVQLKKIGDVPGYRFMGWLYEDTFKMPSHDVVIQGEWKKVNGFFAPSIRITDITGKEFYRPGDVVELEIPVTNNEDYVIKEVQVKGGGDLEFVSYSGYSLRNEHVAVIESIPARGEEKIRARYVVKESDVGSVTIDAEVTSALADNDYLFDETKKVQAYTTITMASSLKVCNQVHNGTGNENFGFYITGNGYESWVSSREIGCKTLYLAPGKYTVREVVPQEFLLDKNNQVVNLGIADSKTLTFTNTYKKHGFYHSVKWLFKGKGE